MKFYHILLFTVFIITMNAICYFTIKPFVFGEVLDVYALAGIPTLIIALLVLILVKLEQKSTK